MVPNVHATSLSHHALATPCPYKGEPNIKLTLETWLYITLNT